jgi:hypothetical protein
MRHLWSNFPEKRKLALRRKCDQILNIWTAFQFNRKASQAMPLSGAWPHSAMARKERLMRVTILSQARFSRSG